MGALRGFGDEFFDYHVEHRSCGESQEGFLQADGHVLLHEEDKRRAEYGAQKRDEKTYYAGCHLHLTGDTMAPSFLSSAKTLSTSLRSAPRAAVTSPAETGLPAARMAAKT